MGATERGAATPRLVSRVMTLVVAVGFAVVGIAGAASAHHNTVDGKVVCKTGGGWSVTWTVTNSETTRETITASSRPSVLPVNTRLDNRQMLSVVETITTKPTAPVTLTVNARWDNGVVKNNDSFSIPVSSFADNCVKRTVAPPTVPVVDACGPNNAVYGTVPAGNWTVVRNNDGSLTITANAGYQFDTNGTTVKTYPKPTDSNTPCPTTTAPPTVPVVDDCGPGNAHFGTVPTGPWTAVTNPDGSLTITANAGYQFNTNGQTSVTYPAPADSNVACPTPPVTPPTTTPPVTNPPPEVLPEQVRVVKAAARAIDKCGTSSDLFKVSKNSGIVYKANGKVVGQGVWLRAKGAKVTIRAYAADDGYRLKGQRVWKLHFESKRCAPAPEVAPDTGR